MFSGDTVSGPIDILRAFRFSPYVVTSRVSVATAALILPESSNKVGQLITARIQHPRSTSKRKSQGE